MSFIGLLKLRATLSIKAESHDSVYWKTKYQSKKKTTKRKPKTIKKTQHQQHQTGVNKMRK